MHAATSKVVNTAQGSSCKLKFVHGKCIIDFVIFLSFNPTFLEATDGGSVFRGNDSCTVWNSITKNVLVFFALNIWIHYLLQLAVLTTNKYTILNSENVRQ